MQEQLDKIEVKIDNIVEVNNQQNIQLTQLTLMFKQNHEILVEHQKRSEASEARIQLMEDKFLSHLSFLRGAMWIVGSIFSVSIAILGLLAKMKIL